MSEHRSLERIDRDNPIASAAPGTEAGQEIRDIAATIDITDSQQVLEYGISAQTELSDFADSVLSEVRARDTGHVGEALGDLMVQVKSMNIDRLSAPQKGIAGLFSRLNRNVRQFLARYQKVSAQIDAIVARLEDAREQLIRDIALLDRMFDMNTAYRQELEKYIAAGDIHLRQLRETELPALIERARQTEDDIDAQRANDFAQMVDRFDRRLHDLRLSRAVALQTGPQLRFIQGGDQALVEKIQSSILTTIPLWKNQVVIAVTLMRQKNALEMQRRVTETTNELLEKNAALLRDNVTGAAREMERGIVEIETLKKVNAELIATIDECLKIQEDGYNQRRQAEAELTGIETELRQKLLTVRSGASR